MNRTNPNDALPGAFRRRSRRLLLSIGLLLCSRALAGQQSDADHLSALRAIADLPAAEQLQQRPRLQAALEANEPSVRLTAVETVARIGYADPVTIDALIRLLDEPNGEAGATVVNALVAQGEAAVPPLEQAVSHSHSLAAERACQALTRLRPDRYRPPCVARIPEGLSEPGWRQLAAPLLRQAKSLRDYDGRSFYAVAGYLDSAGYLQQLTPRFSDLRPDQIADDYRQQLDPPGPRDLAWGMLEDQPMRQQAKLWLAHRNGDCRQLQLPYGFDASGQLYWLPALVQLCDRP